MLLLIGSVAFAALVSAEDGQGQHNYFTTKDGIKIHYMTLGSKGSHVILQIDLRSLDVPLLAINGEYDAPYSKTFRLWREAKDFTNVILPGKSHLTAIAAPYIPKEYAESLVRFIDANDE